MSRLLLALGLLAALAAPAVAQEPARTSAAVDVEDKDALDKYLREQFRVIGSALNDDPGAAETQLKALKAEVEKFRPKAADSRALLDQARDAIKFFDGQIELARTPLADLETKLKANPGDGDALQKYTRKLANEIGATMDADVDAAEKILASGKKFLGEVAAAGKTPVAKAQVDQVLKGLANLEARLAAEKARAKLIGQDAAPLNVEAWVNGSPLTDADLKGKVVLLDFWAIWCAPCIATFPHLRDWNEKYADKGLVILGLTQYYNYDWDAKAGRPVRSQEQVTPEHERAMLVKFGQSHKLTHRFGIQKDQNLAEFYGVAGIPQVVVIDREGKVRLIKVGAQPENAEAIGALLEKLIAEPKAGGE